nr:MAG TPA: protein of unknown function (DUF3870) [Caudoviricetes sp.]
MSVDIDCTLVQSYDSKLLKSIFIFRASPS